MINKNFFKNAKRILLNVLISLVSMTAFFKLFGIDNIRMPVIILFCFINACLMALFRFFSMDLTENSRNTTKNKLTMLLDVNYEELLGRSTVKIKRDQISGDVNGKVVLVTGGAGSIGSEICRQLLLFGYARLILIDFNETGLFEIENELAQTAGSERLIVKLVSIQDKNRMAAIFKQYQPDIVFHAAAHKHVPVMEMNVTEAVKNNVFGTLNVIQLSCQFRVKKLMLISSDKAVNATNVMGATKRVSEMLMQVYNGRNGTAMSCVRFGNVLGSTGSVLPIFKKQILAGGPITLTHKEVTRYFMTIPEATQLVLQAGALSLGGEIFFLDMGKPVRIYDLACSLIKQAGLRPHKDIKIKITGLRPGEKLYEELSFSYENVVKTKHDMIFVCNSETPNVRDVLQALTAFRSALVENDEVFIKKHLFRLVSGGDTPPDTVHGGGRKSAAVLTTAIVAACVFMLTGCGGAQAVSGGETSVLTVASLHETVTAEDIDYLSHTAATLVPARLTDIRFEKVSGPLAALYIEPLDVITAGDPVAALGTEEYEKKRAATEIEAQKWRLKNELASYTLREAELNVRLLTIERENARGGTAVQIEHAEIQLEKALNTLEMLNISQRLSEIDYRAFSESFEELKAQTAAYTLNSLYSGTIVSVEKLRVGDPINEGETIARVIENKNAVLALKSSEALSLTNQTELEVTIEGEVFAGFIYTPVQSDDIYQPAEERAANVCYIAFKESVPPIPPNKTIAVTVGIHKKAALVVDKNCVKTVGGLTFVDLFTGETYIETPVVCGVETGDKIEIIAGLNEGDIVSSE